jgi:hypothetical protein
VQLLRGMNNDDLNKTCKIGWKLVI